MVCAEQADHEGNLFTGPNTEDTQVIVEAAAFHDAIVIVQVNEIVDRLPRVDIPASWVDIVVEADKPSINSALMMLRRKRIRSQVSIEVPSDVGNESLRWEIPDKCANQEDLYIQHENRARLKAAISHLPRTYRDIVEFRQESEGSFKEIAAHAGISIGAAKSRVLRATRELRKSLAEDEAVSAKQPKCL